jgi:hypothetical protein
LTGGAGGSAAEFDGDSLFLPPYLPAEEVFGLPLLLPLVAFVEAAPPDFVFDVETAPELCFPLVSVPDLEGVSATTADTGGDSEDEGGEDGAVCPVGSGTGVAAGSGDATGSGTAGFGGCSGGLASWCEPPTPVSVRTGGLWRGLAETATRRWEISGDADPRRAAAPP